MMDLHDIYRELFLEFLSQGMTHAEALEQFDDQKMKEALDSEIEAGDCARSFNVEKLQFENACGHETLFDLVVKANFEKSNSVGGRDMDQAMELWQAGWTSEDIEAAIRNPNEFWSQSRVMSWYWRAPSKRAGKPGRLYRSTNQAYSALTRNTHPSQ